MTKDYLEPNPDCPDCETDVLVAAACANNADYVCHNCDARFTVDGDGAEIIDYAGEGSVTVPGSSGVEPRG